MLPKFVALLALPILAAAARHKNAILLSEVQTLTLKGNGAKTASRRVSAVPQLKCVSSKAICDLFNIDVMRCTNQGSSYGGEDVEWSCTATLPEELKLGSTEVICEGYASRDDPNVLKGSCGVEYRMALTKAGERRYPNIDNPSGAWFGDGEGGTDLSAWAFTIIFVAVLGVIVYSACYSNNDNDPTRPRRRRGPGGGGGGGGGGWNPGFGGPGDEPPPPYPGTKPYSTQQQQQGWSPGFWSGLAGGAAAGYMAGGRNRDSGRHQRDAGGGWGAGPSRSSGSSSSSSAQRESTGFGSTSRR